MHRKNRGRRGGGGGHRYQRNDAFQETRRHPPGLSGRQIGMYYKNLSMTKKKHKNPGINFKIPDNVLHVINHRLIKIESIAATKNISLPPLKKLEFENPTQDFAFTPPQPIESNTAKYGKTNSKSIIQNDDNKFDVKKVKIECENEEFLKTKKDVELKNNVEVKQENNAKYTKSNIDAIKQECSTSSNETYLQDRELEVTTYFVSNNYTNRNEKNNLDEQSNKYKYTYEDIITGTFQEKLDECLDRGIEIMRLTQEVSNLNKVLKEKHEYMKRNPKYRKMLEFRKTLPTFKKGTNLLDVIDKNQVVVISGETGCGKSTQVPQLILDDAIESGAGANVKILVTEPRRIAASSLADRVAEERGERIGDSVGYCVRLESVPCRDRGSIKFCTTGVLLVEMEQNQALGEYSHIIMDEVHERDCQIDIAMCMVKQVLKKRPDLKLILMSATIDAESLSEYFDNCPMFHIEGLAYPVKDVYLEDILQMTDFKLPYKPDFVRETKAWHKYAKKKRQNVAQVEKDIQYRAEIHPWLSTLKTYKRSVMEQLQDQRIEELNIDLTLELLKHISKEPPGAILVFLPGIVEIKKLISMMNESRCFPQNAYEIYALHSKLPTIEQKKIFDRPPHGVRKIIIATNIAETSITIDDVVYVVDCGKMKYKGLDVEKNLSTLRNEWISKANLRQRRGRAGRCQAGICYHLLTSYRANNIPDRLLPELQRSNLLEEVLTIKRLRLGRAEEALNMMPAVPDEKTILAAINHLQEVGALDENETLTPMGWHLARLPVPPAAGKLLVLGALFGCLDRAASVAAVWGFKDPFQLVLGKEDIADEKKRDLALGEPSDHIAISEAVINWEQSRNQWGFAREYFLAHKTLELISNMKQQFAGNLKEMGFLNIADTKSPWENRNENNLSLFKAIVAASLYPNVASVRWLNAGSIKKPLRIKAFTPEEGCVSIHPSSVMYTRMDRRGGPICRQTGANWLVYGTKQKSLDIYLLDVTCVFTLPLLFFGALNVTKGESPGECEISIASKPVHCKTETAQLLFHLRSLLDQVLTFRIGTSRDSEDRQEFDQEVLNAVISLITAEDEGTQYMDYGDENNSETPSEDYD